LKEEWFLSTGTINFSKTGAKKWLDFLSFGQISFSRISQIFFTTEYGNRLWLARKTN